jgi:guanylate kinase
MSAAFPKGNIVVLTAPSGAGKTTIARLVMEAIPEMGFSVSMTTRPPRPHERHGVHYYFTDEENFRRRVSEGDFIEYEEVYPGRLYGTLREEIDRRAASGPVLLDVDVRGAVHIKEIFDDSACAIFILPPSADVLADRLRARGTETPASLEDRLLRARDEMQYFDRFDAVIINDELETAVEETLKIIHQFLNKH